MCFIFNRSDKINAINDDKLPSDTTNLSNKVILTPIHNNSIKKNNDFISFDTIPDMKSAKSLNSINNPTSKSSKSSISSRELENGVKHDNKVIEIEENIENGYLIIESNDIPTNISLKSLEIMKNNHDGETTPDTTISPLSSDLQITSSDRTIDRHSSKVSSMIDDFQSIDPLSKAIDPLSQAIDSNKPIQTSLESHESIKQEKLEKSLPLADNNTIIASNDDITIDNQSKVDISLIIQTDFESSDHKIEPIDRQEDSTAIDKSRKSVCSTLSVDSSTGLTS